MYSIDLVKQILQQLRKYKLRSFLAMFGILWGTLSIVMLLSLSNGFAKHQQEKLKAAANNFIVVNFGPTKLSFHGTPAGQVAKITIEKILQLKNLIPGIRAISTEMNYSGAQYAQSADHAHTIKILPDGISADFTKIFGMKLAPGSRPFTKLDDEKQANITIINSYVASSLLPGKNALGKIILINEVPFKVVGVIQNSKDASSHSQQAALTYIPYTTYQKLFGTTCPSYFVLSTYQLADIPNVVHALKNYFAIHYHIAPDDPQGMMVYDSTRVYGFVHWFFTVIQVFFLLCGLMTLAVGGIGVANIMFLIISQRSKEIGIRMAIGAKKRHIIFQVLLESSIIVLLGGLLGFIISAALIIVLPYFHLPEWLGTPHLNVVSALITMLALMLVATLAGFFPARRAALMNPVDAINKRGT